MFFVVGCTINLEGFICSESPDERLTLASKRWILYWDGTGLVMAYKRLEEATFTWPAIKDGMMALNHAQFEALFAGLDWRKVKALEMRPPAAAE